MSNEAASSQLLDVALRIREMREIIGYSTATMAKMTDVDEKTYVAYESGKADLPFTFMHKCALAFGVEITELLEGSSAKLTGYTVTQSGYEGFMIYSIEKGSSLEGTDIRQYDIITKVDNTVVKSRTEVRNALSKHKPGDKVTLSIKRIVDQRSGEVQEFTREITLKEITS